MENYKVIIRGFGLVTAMGQGGSQNFQYLSDEKSAVKKHDVFPYTSFAHSFVEKDESPLVAALINRDTTDENEFRSAKMMEAFDEMLANSEIDISELQGEDTILSMGSSIGGSDNFIKGLMDGENMGWQAMLIDYYTDQLVQHYGLTGESMTFSTACASSANAIDYAFRMLHKPNAKYAIVGGVDFLSAISLLGFSGLHAIDHNGPRPFSSNRSGMNLGEGIGFALLERVEAAQHDEIELVGTFVGNDAYHVTSPNPLGVIEETGMINVWKKIGSNKPGYINAHGTGTQLNDEMERDAVTSAFSDSLVSSTKSYTGHTLGAAGIVELILSLLMLKEGRVMPTLNLDFEEPRFNRRVVDKKVNWAISNSFAFGGNVVTIGLKKAEEYSND